MIMQALADLYEVLAGQGKVPKDGWARVRISREICLRADGSVEQIVDLKIPQEKGKPKPQEMIMPDWGSAAGSGVRSNFLFNQAGYMLGITERETADNRLKSMVEDCNRLHHAVLDGLNLPETKAALLFLDAVADGKALSREMTASLDGGALSGDNFIISVDGKRLHEIPEVRKAWDSYYASAGDGEPKRCLVTGDMAPPADKHPFIKGLRGAQGSGAGLSNYNAESFCSYGYEQNNNAPVSRHAAYAYTQALTYLLGSNLYHRVFGDGLTIVWWAEDAGEEYGELLLDAVFGGGEDSKWTDEDIAGALDALSKGRMPYLSGLDGKIDPGRKFFMLGLSPNATRIIVRFFLRDTFGAVMGNVAEHYRRLEIAGSDGKLTTGRAFRAMVRSDVDKELPETVIEHYFRSVLFGHRYPARMRAYVSRRIALDTDMLWQRTALIKAYFLQTLPKGDKRKECFAMSLVSENREPGYLLGRLFALYEAAQNVGLEKDPWNKAQIHSMFGSAMTAPGGIFPRLTRLTEVHLAKEENAWYAKQIQEVKNLLPGAYPSRLDLTEQGMFDLGYYHQRQFMFAKKEGAKNSDELSSENTKREE